ncbi:hypothetical protein ScPMuIL_011158 [Solemya velum]
MSRQRKLSQRLPIVCIPMRRIVGLNTASFLYGVDSFFGTRHQEATTICQTRTWVISRGFTLVFAPMLAKAWREQRIFNSSSGRRVVIKDRKLLAIVALLVLVDIAVLAMWLLLDPMQSTIVRYSREKKTIIMELEHRLSSAQEKLAKMSKGVTGKQDNGVVFCSKHHGGNKR